MIILTIILLFYPISKSKHFIMLNSKEAKLEKIQKMRQALENKTRDFNTSKSGKLVYAIRLKAIDERISTLRMKLYPDEEPPKKESEMSLIHSIIN